MPAPGEGIGILPLNGHRSMFSCKAGQACKKWSGGLSYGNNG